eukprot:351444_1
MAHSQKKQKKTKKKTKKKQTQSCRKPPKSVQWVSRGTHIGVSLNMTCAWITFQNLKEGGKQQDKKTNNGLPMIQQIFNCLYYAYKIPHKSITWSAIKHLLPKRQHTVAKPIIEKLEKEYTEAMTEIKFKLKCKRECLNWFLYTGFNQSPPYLIAKHYNKLVKDLYKQMKKKIGKPKNIKKLQYILEQESSE